MTLAAEDNPYTRVDLGAPFPIEVSELYGVQANVANIIPRTHEFLRRHSNEFTVLYYSY